MGKSDPLEKAQEVIEWEDDPVVYHGQKWYWFQKWTPSRRRAAEMLEDAGKLVRWSEKTPELVRLV